jgi:hypothetical protein
VLITGSGVCTWTADSNESIPAGNANYYLFATAVEDFPSGGASVALTISGNKSGSGLVNGYVTVPGTATYDDTYIVSGTDEWTSVSGVTCTGGTANQWIDIWAIPDIDQFTDLVYVRSFDAARGVHMEPVPDGFDPAATHVRVRRTPTFSVTKDYVDPNVLDIIRGREVCVIIEIHPDGLSVVQEYLIMPKAAVSADVNAPDAAMVQAVAAGSARVMLSYTPSG